MIARFITGEITEQLKADVWQRPFQKGGAKVRGEKLLAETRLSIAKKAAAAR